MTKDNFVWCLKRTTGKARLWLRTDGDGWRCAYHLTLLCVATGKVPKRDKDGKGIGSLHKGVFVIGGFQGGDLIAVARNDKCSDRARKALEKYRRWAREAIGCRFNEKG